MTRPVRDWLLAGAAAVGVAGLTAWWSAPTPGSDDAVLVEPARRGAAPIAADAATPRPAVAPSTLGPAHVERPPGAPDREPWPELSPRALAAWGDRPPAPRALARQSPVPAASAPAAPPAPAPPPPGWRYVGRIHDAGSTRAVLVHASQGTAVVGASDTLDGQWRVESIRVDAVELLWLPGGVRQRLMAPT